MRLLKPGPKGLFRRGSVLILMTLSLFLLFACISLVVDLGFAYFKRQQAQAAADAAASAAAVYALNNGYTCGSGGVVCNTTYTCAYPAVTPPTTPLQAGCLYASVNGLNNTGTQTVTLIQNNTAPPGVSGNSPSLWIEADVSQSLSTMFGLFASIPSLAIKAKSLAAVSRIGTTNCIVGLSSSGTAVTLSNMSGFTAGCGVASNSGLSLTGVGSMTTSATTYVGSYSISNSGTPSPTPTHVATATSDPLSGLPAPSFTSTCDHTSYSSSASPLNPGTYCNGLEIGNATSFTFNSGVYIINGGYLDLTGATTVTGSGVTFFLTGGKYSQPALNGLSWSNINNFNMVAPTSGTYKGILVFQDPTATLASGASNTIQSIGGGTASFTGTIYLPTMGLTYYGTANPYYEAIIAQTILMQGVGNILLDTTGTKTGLLSYSAGTIY